MIPELVGDGILVTGDAAALQRNGVNLEDQPRLPVGSPGRPGGRRRPPGGDFSRRGSRSTGG
jgi:hypothetical protein